MIRSFFLFLLMLPCMAYAQDSSKDLKLFNGKAAIKLPTTFNSTSAGAPVDVKNTVVYSNDKQTVECSIEKNATATQLKKEYDEIKLGYNFEYLDVLRDEFVNKDNGRTDCYLECKLKPAFYNKNGTGGITMASGRVYPNHFIIYKTQQKGQVATIVIDYKGAENELQQMREQNGSIISTFKLL